MVSSFNSVTTVLIDHGWGGAFARYVGWWVLLLVGLAAASLLPLGLVRLAGNGQLTWSAVSELLAWFGLGPVMAFGGYQLFRTRRSFTTVALVDDRGIVLKSGDRLDQWVRWEELTSARIDPLMTRIELSAPTLQRPFFLVNGAAPYTRFRILWKIIQEQAGPVATVVMPSKTTRAAVIAIGSSVVPLAVNKMVNGDLFRGAILMAIGALAVYAGISGFARLFRSPKDPLTTVDSRRV